jgi:hypothetical protein
MQVIVVALAVIASTLYAAYVLMPRTWRQKVDGWLERVLPEAWSRRRAGRASGCDGCANNPAAPRPETRVHVHDIGRRG